MKAKIKILILSIFLLLACNQVKAASSDLIAVRIIPNPEHYSVERWYQVQGFKGNPQKITVDGYEAIRDGRTVYVNAVYTTGTNLYTNIYIISYNQESEKVTADIMDNIISHWKFNNSLSLATGVDSKCSISGKSCQKDDDCGDYACTNNLCDSAKANPNSNVSCSDTNPCASGYNCSNEKCIKDVKATYCNIDSDCSDGFFCDSQKAKLIRNIKRLSAITEIREKLEEYNKSNNRYPDLGAGTYIPETSVSTWPSWTETFLPKIGADASLSDLINILAKCKADNAENSKYDPRTCWDERTNRFADSNPDNSILNLPLNSYAFVYEGQADGANFRLCANLEPTNFSLPQLSEIDCNDHSGSSYGSAASNSEPKIIEYSLLGEAGRPFNGFIRAYDPEGQAISWNIDTTPGNPWFKWSQAPATQNANRPNEKKLYSAVAGEPGEYPIKVTLTDAKGMASVQDLKVVVRDNAPIIRSGNFTYTANISRVFDYTMYFEGENLTKTKPTHSLKVEFGKPTDSLTVYEGTNDLRYGLVKEVKKLSEGKYSLRIYTKNNQGLSTDLEISKPLDFKFNFSVTDDNGKKSSSDFVIRINPDTPVLNFNCPTSVRVNESYFCKVAVDNWEGHDITYKVLPTNLFVSGNAGAAKGDNGSLMKFVWLQKISGWWHRLFSQVLAEDSNTNSTFDISGVVGKAGTYDVTVIATNEYKASSSKVFKLRVDNYCGDGIRQSPNLERRGGIYDNGYELCDGLSGIATSSPASSPLVQYSCSYPKDNVQKPLENNSCYPNCCVPRGGFCGDGICQASKESNDSSDPNYCKIDCPSFCKLEIECGYDDKCGYDIKCPSLETCVEDQGGDKTKNKCEIDWPSVCAGRCGDVSYKGLSNFCGDCANGQFCSPDNKCEVTDDYCASNNFCGRIEIRAGEFVDCPICDGDQECNIDHQCVPKKDCGETNEPCGENQSYGDKCCNGTCVDGNCKCDPVCGDNSCGQDNGCGSKCNKCPVGQRCTNGACVASCVPACSSGQMCVDGKCVCAPNCNAKNCGSDGCGGFCGSSDGTCPNDQRCVDGNCHTIECSSNSDCGDANDCTDDSCNNPGLPTALCVHSNNTATVNCETHFPGNCIGYSTKVCSNGSGVCSAKNPRDVTCTGKTCGDDGCGGNCGTCLSGQICDEGNCYTPACSSNSDCEDDEPCTDNSCVYAGTKAAYCYKVNNNNTVDCSVNFGSCVTPGHQNCVNGQYSLCSAPGPRVGYCSTRNCGSDGCGGTCGPLNGGCQANYHCSSSGNCVHDNCYDFDCGTDGFGGSCGTCPSGKTCNDSSCIDSYRCLPAGQWGNCGIFTSKNTYSMYAGISRISNKASCRLFCNDICATDVKYCLWRGSSPGVDYGTCVMVYQGSISPDSGGYDTATCP